MANQGVMMRVFLALACAVLFVCGCPRPTTIEREWNYVPVQLDSLPEPVAYGDSLSVRAAPGQNAGELARVFLVDAERRSACDPLQAGQRDGAVSVSVWVLPSGQVDPSIVLIPRGEESWQADSPRFACYRRFISNVVFPRSSYSSLIVWTP